MHIFITGATGFVGTHLVPLLLSGGHTLSALARSSSSADKLSSLGITPVRGSLAEPATLIPAALAADTTIHLAFEHDWSRWAEVCEQDRRVILALGDALQGSGKKLIITSGMIFAHSDPDGPVRETHLAQADERSYRAQTENHLLEYKDKGVVPIVLRLPPSVHGVGDGAFIPALIGMARKNKVAPYVQGKGVWAAVHVKDAAALFALVADKGETGVYHAAHDNGIPFKDIAEAIAEGVGTETRAVQPQEMGGLVGMFGMFGQANVSATADRSKALGWQPKEVGLLEDMAQGHYFGGGGVDKMTGSDTQLGH